MDLYAYSLMMASDELSAYVKKNYGDVPRPRGFRLMRLCEPSVFEGDSNQAVMFRSHCGDDVLYVHTRCGAYGDEDDCDCNYIACGGRDFEEQNSETFIESIDDLYDPTYRDHYFKAVKGEEYDRLLESVSKLIDKAKSNDSDDE